MKRSVRKTKKSPKTKRSARKTKKSPRKYSIQCPAGRYSDLDVAKHLSFCGDPVEKKQHKWEKCDDIKGPAGSNWDLTYNGAYYCKKCRRFDRYPTNTR